MPKFSAREVLLTCEVSKINHPNEIDYYDFSTYLLEQTDFDYKLKAEDIIYYPNSPEPTI